MSTSYTGTLKLGKPAAGDTGWGNTLNGEVTDMVEEAIAGMSTINTWSAATPAVHTLTEANGSTAEARAAILRLTDTTGDIASVANLIVPDNTKLYCIINETGHTVTVKTASGTGIAIPTAVQNNVVCNGTNVVEQTNYADSILATTLTADNLKITAGGTAITGFVDEDDMASNSAVKVASQQSIKAYVDNNGEFYRGEKIIPWALISDATTNEPFATLDETLTTVAEFSVPGSADSEFQAVDLAVTFRLHRPDSGNTVVKARYNLQKKTKVTTGVSLGTVAVAPAQKGGSSSTFFQISIATDIRDKLDLCTVISANNGASGAKDITSINYDTANNRTDIVYDNGSTTAGSSFSNVGDTVYYAVDGYESVGAYLSVDEIFISSAYIDGGFGAPVTNTQVSLPTFLLKNSNSAATEFRLQAASATSDGKVLHYAAYVTAKNIRRG
jgi:hypothetical protein